LAGFDLYKAHKAVTDHLKKKYADLRHVSYY